jgi:hypothetical protein
MVLTEAASLTPLVRRGDDLTPPLRPAKLLKFMRLDKGLSQVFQCLTGETGRMRDLQGSAAEREVMNPRLDRASHFYRLQAPG